MKRDASEDACQEAAGCEGQLPCLKRLPDNCTAAPLIMRRSIVGCQCYLVSQLLEAAG